MHALKEQAGGQDEFPGKILLLTKQDQFCAQAEELSYDLFGDGITVHRGAAGDPPPVWPDDLTDTWIISFRSPWIVPPLVLQTAKMALNFHPGSSRYPGYACYNLALYEGSEEYGVVCHIMDRKVDAGEILVEKRFPIFRQDSVQSLQRRTWIALLALFQEVMCAIAGGKDLPRSGLAWERKASTREDLLNLAEIDPSMPREEIARRIRAVSHPKWPEPLVTPRGASSPIAEDVE